MTTLTARSLLDDDQGAGLLDAGLPPEHALVAVGDAVGAADGVVVQRAGGALAEGEVVALHAHRVV